MSRINSPKTLTQAWCWDRYPCHPYTWYHYPYVNLIQRIVFLECTQKDRYNNRQQNCRATLQQKLCLFAYYLYTISLSAWRYHRRRVCAHTKIWPREAGSNCSVWRLSHSEWHVFYRFFLLTHSLRSLKFWLQLLWNLSVWISVLYSYCHKTRSNHSHKLQICLKSKPFITVHAIHLFITITAFQLCPSQYTQLSFIFLWFPFWSSSTSDIPHRSLKKLTSKVLLKYIYIPCVYIIHIWLA